MHKRASFFCDYFIAAKFKSFFNSHPEGNYFLN